MKEIKVSAVSQDDLGLTRHLYDCLLDIASYKHEDRGFSFFIKKDYLEGFIKDVENDRKNNPNYKYLSSSEIDVLHKLLLLCGDNRLLLIDNDGLI